MPPHRNDPCPCGSGRKYERCCLKREAAAPNGSAGRRSEHLAGAWVAEAVPLPITIEDARSPRPVGVLVAADGFVLYNDVLGRLSGEADAVARALGDGVAHAADTVGGYPEVVAVRHADVAGTLRDVLPPEIAIRLDPSPRSSSTSRENWSRPSVATRSGHPWDARRRGGGETFPRSWSRSCSRSWREQEVWPIHEARILADLTWLLRKRVTRFELTARGRTMLDPARAGELFALTFETMFRRFNIFYGGYAEWPELQHQIAFTLRLLGEVAKGWRGVGDLVAETVLPFALECAPDAGRIVDEDWLFERQVLRQGRYPS